MIMLFKRALLTVTIFVTFNSLGFAQLGPTMPGNPLPGPMETYGVFTCVSTSNTICGQASGYDDVMARYACGIVPVAYCFRSY